MYSKTISLFNNADHDAFKFYLESNPVPQYALDRCLFLGFENVQEKNRALSDVTPRLSLLLKKGAKWNDGTVLKHRMTPYHIICQTTGDNYELLDLMIASCQQLLIDSLDSSRCTPLLYCIQNANINCMKSLIAKGADVDIECDSYNFSDNSLCLNTFSPIVDAIRGLKPSSKLSSVIMMEIIDLLFDSKEDANKFYGMLPQILILLAMSLGYVECTKKLLRRGARLDKTTWPSSRLLS